MMQGNLLRLHTAHGKSRHSPVAFIRKSGILSVNIRNTVLHKFLLKGTHRRMACTVRPESIARIHYDEHFRHPAGRKQIISHIGNLALPEPPNLIFSPAMLQVEYRISPAATGVIPRRRIDITQFRPPRLGRCIIVHMHLAMRDVLQFMICKFRIRHIQIIDGLETSISHRCLHIQDSCAVYVKRDIMESRLHILHNTAPISLVLRILLQTHTAAVEHIHFHLVRIGRIQGNLHASICHACKSWLFLYITAGRPALLIRLETDLLIHRIKK